MPSRENMFVVASGDSGVPDFKITPLQVDQLVSEIKENLRLSAATTMKAHRASGLSRKLSRASPYKIPSRCCNDKTQQQQRKSENVDDPYELLQKLLRDGSLVQEAVRRVQLGLTPKQRYYYDSEDEACNSPALRFHDNSQCSQEITKCN